VAVVQQPMTSSIRSWLEHLYWVMESKIVPGLTPSQEAYHDILTQHVDAGTRWLDLGCGTSLLPSWQQDSERRLIARSGVLAGLDRSLPSLKANRTMALRVCGDIARLPFPDGSFDLVTANMVVEHLDDPVGQFREIRRVLARGGMFVCHTPNVRGYPVLASRLVPNVVKRLLIRGLEGRRREDVFKTYYRANSPRALHRIARASKLKIRDVLMTFSSAVLAVVPPLALLELLWIRALRRSGLQGLRPTMIATFTRD
jgi:ubiquinone/menaquinone biosynthesis C-methylase UbiE